MEEALKMMVFLIRYIKKISNNYKLGKSFREMIEWTPQQSIHGGLAHIHEEVHYQLRESGTELVE